MKDHIVGLPRCKADCKFGSGRVRPFSEFQCRLDIVDVQGELDKSLRSNL